MSDSYAELHLHSAYSLREGASLPDELVARAAELGLPALAITDHDALYGVIPFYTAARAAGIKPLIGAELTLRAQPLEPGDETSSGVHHVTLLARDRRGYANLCRLLTQAHLDNEKDSPAVGFETLAQHTQGLVCLSGCRQGEIPAQLLAGRRKQAMTAARRYASVFGPDNFWLELQHNFLPEDRDLIADQVELARHLGLRYVATGNTHYHVRERHRLQDVLVTVRHRATLDTSHHLRRPNSEFYLKSPAEMAERFALLPEALTASLRLAEECSVTLDFTDYRFPDFELPPGETAESYLARLCQEGALRKYGHTGGEVAEKLAYELGLIGRLGLCGYFLIVWDLMRFARERGIPAQGRGSAANSIVAYVLGLTTVDPIRHKLFIGRFLNEEMESVPDIDIDFSRDHREEVIAYVYQKYGREHAALVNTIITYQARSAVRDVGKALGLPQAELERLCKHLEGRAATEVAEELAQQPEFADRANSPLWRQLTELCHDIADFPRHLSQHVGGMVISSCPLVEIVPLEKARMPDRIVTHWDKDSIADAGLIKIDLLSLGMLSLIHEAVALIEEVRGVRLDLERVPLNDSHVYDLLCSADTLGIFQVESRAQMQALPRSQPRSFLDIVAQIAIIRPGPLQGKMVHPYLRRRRGLEPVSYPHPKLRPVLEETLGVVLYQEQCIRVAIEVAGFSAGEAEQLRRAMSRKRSQAAMERLRARFVEGALGNEVDERTAGEVWEMLKGFAAFGFCKSHAAAFAWITYQSAWLRLYYSPEFYAALLNNQPMGFYSPEVIVNDARRHGIEVLPVDVNASGGRCTVEFDRLRIGFRYVQGIGPAGLERLEEERQRGPYASLSDFCRRTRLSREAIENLIEIGAFDCFGLARRELLWQLGLLWRAYFSGRQPAGIARMELPVEQDMVVLPPMTPGEEAQADYTVSGLSTRYHWMDFFRPHLGEDVVSSRHLARLPNGIQLRIAGLVVCRQRPATAKGFLFMTLEDEWGLSNVVIRPQVYQRDRRTIRTQPLVLVEGRLQQHDGVINVVATRIVPLPYSGRKTAPQARSFR